MAWIREIEVYGKGQRHLLQTHAINVPTRILFDLFGPRVFDAYAKTWIEDDDLLAWPRLISAEQAAALSRLFELPFAFDVQQHDYWLATSEAADTALDQQHIEEFLAWFAGHAPVLAQAYDQPACIEQIDDQLDRVHPRLGWEIGPLTADSLYFAVSPALDPELVPLARGLLNAGQALMNKHAAEERNGPFEFRLGRQRRPWSDVLQLSAQGVVALSEVNLANWQHRVFRVPDSERFDIVFACGEQCPLTEAERDEVASLLASALLGEMLVLETVDQIEVITSFAGERAQRAKPAAWLPYAFGLQPL